MRNLLAIMVSMTFICSGCSRAASSLMCPAETEHASKSSANENVEFFCVDKSGKRHGPYAKFSNSGTIQEEGGYNGGLPAGGWTWYYTNGVRQRSGSYVALGLRKPNSQPTDKRAVVEELFAQTFGTQPQKTGWWMEFAPKGEIVKLGLYVDGVLVAGQHIVSPFEPIRVSD